MSYFNEPFIFNPPPVSSSESFGYVPNIYTPTDKPQNYQFDMYKYEEPTDYRYETPHDWYSDMQDPNRFDNFYNRAFNAQNRRY